MGALYGPLGGLDELPCASALSDSPTGPLVTEWTQAVSGRVFGQMAPVMPPREWQLAVGTARPEAADILYRIASRQVRDARPCAFYSEAAQVENLLDPAGATMHPARWTDLMAGGSQLIPNRGDHPRWLESGATSETGTWAHLSNIPIPHERTVTASITLIPWAGQVAYFWVDELRLDGSTHTVHKATTSTEDRLSMTFTTTAETVALTLGVARAVVVVDPQVTLTDRPVSWAPGAGCLNAALTAAPSRTVQAAHMTANDWGRRSAYQWVIRELGDALMAHTG